MTVLNLVHALYIFRQKQDYHINFANDKYGQNIGGKYLICRSS